MPPKTGRPSRRRRRRNRPANRPNRLPRRRRKSSRTIPFRLPTSPAKSPATSRAKRPAAQTSAIFWTSPETAAAPAESLQRESGDEGFTLEHVLGDYGQEERVLESVALRSAIERLTEKEQQVINLRFFHGLTQSDCARILSVSQVQVSRLERRAMENLRTVML